MSFASETKNEIAHSMPARSCCAAAELAGFIRACGSVTRSGGAGVGIRLVTGNAAVARHIVTLTQQVFGLRFSLLVGDAALQGRQHVYHLNAPPGPAAEKLLLRAGILTLSGGERTLAPGFSEALLRRKCCRRACLKGLFLGAGTVADPERAYSLEFAFESHTVARAARKLLGSFEGIHAHIRQRRGSHVVYLSESEQIKDFLNIIGAHAQLLKFENVRVLKDVRNRTNRLNNCDSANYDKSTAAAARQLAVIERLRQDGRLEALPKDLAETARLREEHPEATLTELGSLHTPPISKATVSLRLKKLETLP